MSGYLGPAFRHNCVTDGCYLARHAPDWTWMRGCFPRGIWPTDIDGMVEIGGSFLFLEHKGPGAPFPNGQRIALRNLGQIPEATVLVMREAGAGQLDCLTFDGTPERCSRTVEETRHWLRQWSERVG